jgi:hypothetical protein
MISTNLIEYDQQCCWNLEEHAVLTPILLPMPLGLGQEPEGRTFCVLVSNLAHEC